MAGGGQQVADDDQAWAALHLAARVLCARAGGAEEGAVHVRAGCVLRPEACVQEQHELVLEMLVPWCLSLLNGDGSATALSRAGGGEGEGSQAAVMLTLGVGEEQIGEGDDETTSCMRRGAG